jgi:alanyl-tRNA synthetase
MGFPLDLTQLMAVEHGLSVDLTGFEAAMTAQKERARQALREKRLEGLASLAVDIRLTTDVIATLEQKQVPFTDDSSKYAVTESDTGEI